VTSFVKNVTTGSGTKVAPAAGTTTTPSRPATAGGRVTVRLRGSRPARRKRRRLCQSAGEGVSPRVA
jgi:hypothetical protein